MSLPKWVNPVLQGLAYWIGYKKQLYPHSPLSEGAIIGETINLIYSHLEKSQKLYCEYPYSKILNETSNSNRADLVITENDEVSIIIEVKRLEAGMKRVIADFVKLSGENYTNSKLRRFVLLVCQQKIPKEFITENGDSQRGILRLSTLFFEDVNVRVTRTCKSTFSFKPNAIGKANYVCLIEVL